MKKRKNIYCLVTLMLAVLPINAYSGTVAEIKVFKRGKVVQSGIGSLVAEEKLLASRTLVIQGGQLVVKDPITGAEYVGMIAAQSEKADLAVVSVTGLEGDNFILANESSGAGRKITVAVLEGKAHEGVLHSLLEADTKNPLPRIQHTAVIQDGEFGAPLLNNCGELLGISQSGKKSLLDKRLVASKTFSVAGDLQSLTDFLDKNSVSYAKAGKKCLSVKEQLAGAKSKAKSTGEEVDLLKQQKEQLEKEKEDIAKAKEQLESLTRDQKKALTEKEEELRKREAALKKEQEAKEAALEKKKELEEKRAAQEEALQKAQGEKEKERQRQLYIASGSIAVIIILVLVGWLVLRKRKAQLREVEQEAESSKNELSVEQAKLQAAESELEKSVATFKDIMLMGLDEDGKEHRIKIIGNALIRSPDGQVIGRSAQKADYVISLDQVSREHVRLSVQSGQIMVEDLDSYNGTAINGILLGQGESGVISHNDELRIGTLNCRVHIME